MVAATSIHVASMSWWVVLQQAVECGWGLVSYGFRLVTGTGRGVFAQSTLIPEGSAGYHDSRKMYVFLRWARSQ
jgi:hypothetical protein